MSGELVEKLTAASQYGMCDGYWSKDEPEAPFQLYAEAAAELTRLRSENAELVEALRLADRRLHDDGYTVADPVTMTVMAALARVSGGGK